MGVILLSFRAKAVMISSTVVWMGKEDIFTRVMAAQHAQWVLCRISTIASRAIGY